MNKMTLFTVGPVNMYDYTLKTAGMPLPYFRTSEFSGVVHRINDNLKTALHAPLDSKVCLLTSSGTGAMESAVCSIPDGKKVLVVNGGSFGDRFCKLCDIHHVEYDVLNLPFEQDLTDDILQPYKNKGYFALLINIHETSIGKYYSPQVIKDFCHGEGIYLIIDIISSFLADEFDMTDIGADVVILSSQKALALQPGLGIVVLSPRYYENVVKITADRTLYLGLNEHIKDAERGQTPFTPCLSIIYQLDERLIHILSDGVDAVIQRTKELAEYFRNRILENGFIIPSFNHSNCLTTIICPRNNATQLFENLKNNYNIFVTPCGGANKDKLLRIGHIGNLNKQDYINLLEHLVR